MGLTEKQFAEMKAKIKGHVDNYPDLDAMVANGELIFKSGWYEATSKEALDKIGSYAREFRNGKNGNVQVKVSKMTKQFKSIASKL